jgi:hypothetical protein
LTPAELRGFASYFASNHFDLNFLMWAQVVPSFNAGTADWAGCLSTTRHIGVPCPGGVTFGPVQGNVSTDVISVLYANGGFIALACGNFSKDRPTVSPIPTISGIKFDDRNGNGVQDGTESSLGGVVIHLFNNGNLVATTTTAGNGSYSFSLDVASHPDRGPGTYTLTEDVPAGYHQTAAPGAIVIVPNPDPSTLDHPGNNFGNAKAQPTISTLPSKAVHVGANIFDTATLAGGASPSGIVTFTLYGPNDTACSSVVGTATGNLSGGVAVSGNLVVLNPGTYRWIASYPGDGANYDVASPCGAETVVIYPPISATPAPITGIEGAPLTPTVAHFTDPDPTGTPAEYAATIDWGDGTPATAGTVTQPGGPVTTFSVAGNHTYDEEGPYSTKVTITDVANAVNTANVASTAAITDAALTGTSVVVTATEGLPFTQKSVGTFTDADPHGMVADYSATIDWGDGTPTSIGTITGLPGGPFTVLGDHDYLKSGKYTITVPVLDIGGAKTTIVDTVMVAHAFCTGTLTADPGQVITGTVSGFLHLAGGTWVVKNANVAGPIAVTPGTSLLVTQSSVGGAIDGSPGGELIVSHSTVGGPVIAKAGQPTAVCFSTVSGALSADQGPNGLQVCSSTISGSVAVTGSTDLVMIGDTSKQCGTNKLTSSGAIVFSNDSAGLDLSGNTLSGSLHVSTSGGTSAPRIAGNTIGGSLACDGNTPPPVDGGQPNKNGGTRLGQCSAPTF